MRKVYPMSLDKLLALVSSNTAPGLCIDSRLVKPGDIFVAVKGTIYDGHDFIEQAVTKGAKYIVCCRPEAYRSQSETGCEIIVVEDPSASAAVLAQARLGNPASKLTNLAVTGTNGKTTVAYLVRSCIQNAGRKCGLISTIVYDCVSGSSEATLTTPGCLSIAEQQSQMLEDENRPCSIH